MDTNSSEFYNLYVARVINEVQELTKTKMLLAAQVDWAEQQLQAAIELQNKLQQANNDLMAKVRELTEKKEKKTKKADLEGGAF